MTDSGANITEPGADKALEGNEFAPNALRKAQRWFLWTGGIFLIMLVILLWNVAGLGSSKLSQLQYQQRAEKLFRGKHYEQALEICLEGLEQFPKDASLLFDAGRSLIFLERQQEGLHQLDKIQPESDLYANACFVAGMTLSRNDEHEKALPLLKVAAADPQFEERCQLYLGDSSYGLGEYRQAAVYYENGLDDSPYLSALGLGRSRLELYQAEEARQAFDAAALAEPQYGDPVIGLGRVEVLNGEHEKALIHFKRAAEMKPEWIVPHRHIANSLMELDRFDEAAKHWTILLEDNPESFRALVGLARCYFQKGKLKESSSMADKARALCSEHSSRWNTLGIFFSDSKRLSDAEACYLRAIELDQSNYQPLYNLGILRTKEGKFEEAIELFVHSAELSPTQRKQYWKIALIALYDTKNYELAEEYLRRIMEMSREDSDDHNDALQGLAEIEQARAANADTT